MTIAKIDVKGRGNGIRRSSRKRRKAQYDGNPGRGSNNMEKKEVEHRGR